MELLNSDIKASLQSETTQAQNDRTSPTNIDCCLSQINQAIQTIQNTLFSDYEYNQNTHQALAECDDNSKITTDDKVKVLTARVKSLEKQLLVKESELQATQQELNCTNQDLVAALKPDILTLAEAKELAKNILLNKDSISEYFAKLLSGIYNSTVEASELAPINKYNNIENNLNAQLNKLTSINKAFQEQTTVFKSESLSIKNRVADLQAKSKDIIARTASLKNK
ncbi:hypothetical protein NIES4071_55420 [Calothrix sp. NIES-4071]|nr:hypothetical protein NIES4071_55420 [Calothrix sp. NIES-4071]BAZ59849.1 hypothetical protein NIES4105_55370 [Calothrix sp. NIES-4105]